MRVLNGFAINGFALAALLAVGAIENAAAQTPPPFESIPGSYVANGVSADGGVVVGFYYDSSSAAQRAFRWVGGVLTGLGTLDGGTTSYANAVSANGNVVVGYAKNADSKNEAFRWVYDGTGPNGGGIMTGLDTLGGDESYANAVSADDGNVVVGYSRNSDNKDEAFRWVYTGSGPTGGTMTGLGTLGGDASKATGVSADGNVVVGQSNNGSYIEAFRWVSGATGGVSGNLQMYGLGTLGGAYNYSQATAVSADGNVVVGSSYNSNSVEEAFRWVSGATGGVGSNPQMYGLGFLENGQGSGANAVSADGNVVVGWAVAGDYPAAFRWTAGTGMKSVLDLLTAAKVDMTGWLLYEAKGVSADGNVIVGYGTGPGGDVGWIARLTGGGGGGGGGIITDTEAARSFASLGALGRTGNAALGTTLSTMSQYATQGMDNNACGQSCSRYSVFAVAGYDSDPSGFGKLGMTMRLDEEGTIAGALIGADYIRTDMYADGEATMRGGSAGLFVARAPESGLQWLVGLSGLTISGDVDRGYHNGNTPTASRGNTTGNGYGIEGRLGWTFDQLVSKTKITPFASYTFSSIRYDGYTESGGPFPASFAAFTDEMQTTRLGMDARYTLAPGNWVWGTVAWGHRIKGDGPEISGQLIDLFGMNVPGLTTDADWLEATAGLRMPVSKAAAFTASASVTVPEHQQESYVFRAGLSQAF